MMQILSSHKGYFPEFDITHRYTQTLQEELDDLLLSLESCNLDDDLLEEKDCMDIEKSSQSFVHPSNPRKRFAPEDFDVSSAKRQRLQEKPNPHEMDIEKNQTIAPQVQPANSRKRFAPEDFDVSNAKRPRFQENPQKIKKAPNHPVQKGMYNFDSNLSAKLIALKVSELAERKINIMNSKCATT